jgi:hypothetical protein
MDRGSVRFGLQSYGLNLETLVLHTTVAESSERAGGIAGTRSLPKVTNVEHDHSLWKYHI